MPVPCARCDMPLPKWELARGNHAVCTSCGSENEVRVFPAIMQLAAGPAHSEAAIEGEAACFDHPMKRAVASCRQCGRFVCAVCSVEFGGEVWCPSCVAAGAGQAREAKLETSRMLWDSIVLTLPLASLLMWPFTIGTAPAAVVLAITKRKQPLSLVRRSRWRFVAGAILGAVETAAWGFGIAYLISRAS
jgi:hypothetical protein